jgi:hypothetical protein
MDTVEDATKVLKDTATLRLKGASNCRACEIHITYKRLENGKFDSSPHKCAEWLSWRADC